MASNPPGSLELITITPAIEQFQFRLLLPSGWRKLDTPPEQPDYSNPTAFLPLGIFIHEPTMAIVSIAARPGYGEGTVLDWLKYVAGAQSFKVDDLEPFTISAGAGASALATQENE